MDENIYVRIEREFETIPLTLAGQVKIDDPAAGAAGKPKRILGSLAEAMVLGALVGYRYQRRFPVETPRSDPIRFSVFESTKLDSYVYLLGITALGDLSKLGAGHEHELISVFEEFANGGFQLISEWQAEGDSLYGAILKKMEQEALSLSSKTAPKGPAIEPIIKKKRSIIKPSTDQEP